MKIASSEIALSSAQSFSQNRQESLSLRTGAAALASNASAQSSRVELSSTAQALLSETLKQQASTASAQTASIGSDNELSLPVQLQILKNIIEQLTGRKIHLLTLSRLQDISAPDAPSSSSQAGSASASSQEPSIAFDYRRVTETHEESHFSASGKLVLDDGSSLDFSLQMSLERDTHEETSVSIRSGAAAQAKDPLILSFGSGVHASGERQSFALDARTQAIPVLEGAAYLAIDRNGNNKIDDGSELFGPATGDGFEELATLDSDKNGWIDEADSGFAKLRLWQPDAQGGGSLQSLKTAGVGALYLGRTSTPFTLLSTEGEAQARLRSSGVYLNEDGSAGALQQIDVVA